jgi:hypothetical protein
MSKRLKVYISGPYTQGDVGANMHTHMRCALEIIDLGYAPVWPVCSHFLHMLSPRDYEVWMDVDLAWLEGCSVLLRLPGYSPGGDREVKHAQSLGIPVVYSVAELVEKFPCTVEV